MSILEECKHPPPINRRINSRTGTWSTWRIFGVNKPQKNHARLWEIFIIFHFFGTTSPKSLLLFNNMSDLTYLHHIWVKTAFNYIKFLWKLDLLSVVLAHILTCFAQISIFSLQKLSQLKLCFKIHLIYSSKYNNYYRKTYMLIFIHEITCNWWQIYRGI